MRLRLCPTALALVLPLTLAGQASGQVSYNVGLLSNINQYSGVNDVWGYTSPGGTELAIYGHTVGTSFVDATDPLNAVEVFNLPGPTSGWRDIKTYQNYAYVVTEGSGAGTGVQIVDLTNPLSPVLVTTYTGSGFTTAHNIWIDTGAGIAYGCGSAGGMHILSLADPENPVEIDFFTPYYIHDLYVANGRAYAGAISSGSLRILDVTTPSNPVTIASHFYSQASTHNAWPTLDESHCVTTDEGGSNRMKIWNITNLSNIKLASEYLPSSEPAVVHNALLKNDMAFVSHYKAGVRVVDLTDPTGPVEVGYYDTFPGPGGGFDGCWGVYPFRADDVVYASDRATGLYVLQFTGDFAGAISGQVTDASSGTGLAFGSVDLVGSLAPLTTDGSGNYGDRISGGTYQAITTAFGYDADTATVVVPPMGAVAHDVALSQVPSGTVEVTVLDTETLSPLPGVVLDVLNTPFAGSVSDGAGLVSFSLPVGSAWTVRAARFGRAVTSKAVTSVQGSTTQVTIEMPRGFTDDFDVDQAWVIGAVDDSATGGIWERAIPVASSFVGPVGADADATPTGAGFAYVTENHVPGAFVGSSDVDNGKTTLLSPVFDGSGLGALTLNYQRWFSNRAPSPDNDEFRVDVSTDGGSSWTNLETLTVGTDAWAAVTLDLTAAVPATAAMQLRFVAEDTNAATYVEGGVDDVEILSGATGVDFAGGAGPAGLALSAPVPNPFRDAIELSFRIPSSGRVSLDLFDVTGRRVARLMSGERVGAGAHSVRWSGRDENGRRVTAGVYFARLTTSDGTLARKVVRLD